MTERPEQQASAFFDIARETLDRADRAPSADQTSLEEHAADDVDTSLSNPDDNSTATAFPADASTTEQLPPEARRALVSLMRAGAIIAGQKPKLFEHICRYEKAIQAHLSNMYLRLSLDARAGVAMVLQQEVTGDGDEDDDVYTLISRRTLSLYDTLLLLVLRQFYQEREAAGETRVIVDIERIEAYMTPFLPLTNSSRADKRALSGALDKMTERKLLSTVRGEDGRYEITPVIRYVVNAAFLERLLEQYTQLAREAGVAAAPVNNTEQVRDV